MTVEFKAAHRFSRMAPRKARRVVELIRGRTANQALDVLRHDKHRASRHIHKVLSSAVANALQNPAVKASRLVVSKAYVNEGPLLLGRLRFRPGPMGRAMPFRRRTCHIHVFVADPGASPEVEEIETPAAPEAPAPERAEDAGAAAEPAEEAGEDAPEQEEK